MASPNLKHSPLSSSPSTLTARDQADDDDDSHSLRSLDLEEAKAMLDDHPSHAALMTPTRRSRLQRCIAPCSIVFNLVLFAVLLVVLANPCTFSKRPCVYEKKAAKDDKQGLVLLAEEHGFVPHMPLEKVTFMNDSRYAHDDMFVSEAGLQTILDNWEKDVPLGRGFVHVPDAQAAHLNRPFHLLSNPSRNGFSIASFHQYHCLWMIMRGYGNAVFKTADHDPDHMRHVTHCFDYLRQSVLCAGDAALEGKSELVPSMTDGWGNVHVCRSVDAQKKWIFENRLSDYEGIH